MEFNGQFHSTATLQQRWVGPEPVCAEQNSSSTFRKSNSDSSIVQPVSESLYRLSYLASKYPTSVGVHVRMEIRCEPSVNLITRRDWILCVFPSQWKRLTGNFTLRTRRERGGGTRRCERGSFILRNWRGESTVNSNHTRGMWRDWVLEGNQASWNIASGTISEKVNTSRQNSFHKYH